MNINQIKFFYRITWWVFKYHTLLLIENFKMFNYIFLIIFKLIYKMNLTNLVQTSQLSSQISYNMKKKLRKYEFDLSVTAFLLLIIVKIISNVRGIITSDIIMIYDRPRYRFICLLSLTLLLIIFDISDEFYLISKMMITRLLQLRYSKQITMIINLIYNIYVFKKIILSIYYIMYKFSI